MSWWEDRWHDAEDGAASLLGMKKPSQERAEQQAARDATQRDTQRRNELRHQASTLAQQAGGGFDPPAINQRTNCESSARSTAEPPLAGWLVSRNRPPGALRLSYATGQPDHEGGR
ncbi:hypothetical protein [Gandjariella thermophila]|uniref:Uncharacterized protein n=1 Tax=Gandjariella thermophila TaxID=1931992 RepID=A0A4D4JIG5_9PSEU|nr:hypothetical protein [Gandjariella thermophila]GDY34079.1 hypothetical protein GTS_57120 [Gandjariella thermophila]